MIEPNHLKQKSKTEKDDSFHVKESLGPNYRIFTDYMFSILFLILSFCHVFFHWFTGQSVCIQTAGNHTRIHLQLVV